MRKFIIKISFFIIPFIIFLVITILLIIISTTFLRKNSKFYKIDNKTNTLILGDSHISHAVNDDLILNSKNISKEAEPYYYTYHKLIFFNKQENNIKNIYLGFSYHSLSVYYDQFINGWFSSDIGPSYFFILSLKEQLRVLKWNRKTILFFLKSLIKVFKDHKDEIYNRKTSLYHGFDNYYTESCANTDSIIQRTNFQYFEKNRLTDTLLPSKLNYFYLEKIIKYCNKNNLNLFLLSTPIHKENYNRIPLVFKKLFLSFNCPELIDFTSYVKDDCKFSPDGDHVNKLGAIQVSDTLKKYHIF